MTENAVEPAYFEAYPQARMRREDGILEVVLHTDDGPLRWSHSTHQELERLFLDISKDRDNRVVILTGYEDEFSGPDAADMGHNHLGEKTAIEWDSYRRGGKDLLMRLLDIEVPVIGAVNGPARRHAEIPLLSDIVLASETALFQDSAHFVNGVPPGDGMHIVMPHLLGLNRARYFLFTGQEIHAEEALRLGLVAEVLPPEKLLDRAWELARELSEQRTIVLRNTRLLVTQQIKLMMSDLLEYGLTLEGLAAMKE